MVVLASAVAVLAISCSRQRSSEASAGPPIPAGPLMTTNIGFGFAIHYLPVPKADPSAALAKLLKDRFTNMQHVARLDSVEAGIAVSSELFTNAQQTHPPPSLESLTYFGRGLTREQAVALQSSSTVFLLAFGYPSNHVWSGMYSALQLTEALAQQTGGIIWDVETREAFGIEAWHSKRLKTWTAATTPNIADHTTMHAYNKGQFARAITLGMAKFGLPDIVIDDFAWSLNRNMGHLINLFAQALAEGVQTSGPRPWGGSTKIADHRQGRRLCTCDGRSQCC